MSQVIFIVGGVRSGKSRFAVQIAKRWGKSTFFIATALPSDEEMRIRIEKHRKERPDSWKTIEVTEGGIVEKTRSLKGDVVVVDCLTLYIARQLLKGLTFREILLDIEEFLKIIKSNFKKAILVSNEVGWGVVPENRVARNFSEVIGSVNQLVAENSDSVYLLISGLPLKVK
jgi:adenosylcobinamide kinase/adenosylcobinamide-phosphate guanylyltransferase